MKNIVWIIICTVILSMSVLEVTLYNQNNGNKENKNITGEVSDKDDKNTGFTIIDKTKEKDIMCGMAFERFYEDDKYIYEWNCMKDSLMIVKYKNGQTERVSEALKKGKIKISDLDRLNITYEKREK